ncbi:hypothetical protein T10_1193 [Trichinella papuae]|uniref:Uncharacterized protein n=1 Tax=Trichinella papuae TaxID=268474 RepID=A0A0V1N868_9BILA|nr:hypothetical protein T10_1193 [Trichinella papuae]
MFDLYVYAYVALDSMVVGVRHEATTRQVKATSLAVHCLRTAEGGLMCMIHVGSKSQLKI